MEKLRAYLSDEGVTQKTFAEAVGLSRSHLNEIISGRKRPSLDVAFAIARATNGAISVDSWEIGGLPEAISQTPNHNESSNEQSENQDAA
ncbi:helix-turn-helix transcriptional regulator [Paracoccus sp. R12_1]|uniref:helix-turn-helix transcriptional regulator n=1 Tax=unclassified Paracoccus (in: a-proteobacteria) TaxID=2688777 RepID=UPI001ADA0413|nr:helix-turn-helix transcriptional regulator [Paracoccus sp. R12_2]MBO9488722.1 helix-turn-helix transcriptional regulator [Paracoccus sp. R12_1]